MKINYSISELAKFRKIRNESVKGSPTIRVISNYSHQYLEWVICGHLYSIGINNFSLMESYFEDFYTEDPDKLNCDILILSISFEELSNYNYIDQTPSEQIKYIKNRIKILSKNIKKSIIFVPPPLFSKFEYSCHKYNLYDTKVYPELMDFINKNNFNSIYINDLDINSTSEYLQDGAIAYSPQNLIQMGVRIAAKIKQVIYPPTKLIAVDFDNTLWDGEIAEKGIKGIPRLNKSDSSFALFQKYLLDLSKRGILLLGLTKNDSNLVDEFFNNRSDLILKKNDFIDICAGWDSKSKYLSIALNSLNLTTSGVIFIDDSILERNDMKLSLPSIEIPNLTEHSKWIQELELSASIRLAEFTDEDKKRKNYYKEELNRKKQSDDMKLLSKSEINFQLGLTLESKIVDNNSKELDRCLQLINKTNQFNVSTYRITKNEYLDLCSDGYKFHSYSLRDNVGDYGLIGVSAVNFNLDPNILILTMSCRAMGRNVEQAILFDLYNRKTNKISNFRIKYVETEKNRLLKELLPNIGFDLESSTFSISIEKVNSNFSNSGIKIISSD